MRRLDDKKIDKILLGNIVAFSCRSLFVLHIGTMFLAELGFYKFAIPSKLPITK